MIALRVRSVTRIGRVFAHCESMKKIGTLIASAFLVISGAACHRTAVRPAGGPVERAGRHVDNAVRKVKHEVRKPFEDDRNVDGEMRHDRR